MTKRCNYWCALFAALFVIGCGNDVPRNTAAGDSTPSPPVAPTDDKSLTPAAYIELGLPADDREWAGPDMEKANAVLSELVKEDPAKLPRFNSPRSGKVFARLTNPANLSIANNRSLPMDWRMSHMLSYFTAATAVAKMYLAADPRALTLGAEQLELLGSTLHAAVALAALAAELVPTLDPKDPTYPVRMKGLQGMRGGLATMVSGCLMTLTEAQYAERDRARLLGHLEETLPRLFPHLPDGMKAELPVRLRELEADPKMNFAADRLHALRGQLPIR